VRRAAGALFVFLVVIWLIQFAVWQIGDPARYVGRGEVIPPDFRPGLWFQPTAANEWQNAALNGGTGLPGYLRTRSSLAAAEEKGDVTQQERLRKGGGKGP
jgi:hypothetical protein